ncbi:RDD family protein [Pseudonocardia lacus]|jgi:uncharacterized RDD family membrane protein YckC|uniref:RDD family protein n=1 Tax=Pseudonocardia lacus TaxID=2835865 RepID=UPI001BDC12AA|nr:RDD family protein [Pseudonocardia lacus]
MPGSARDATNDYPGRQFGLPERGVSSAAGFGRRLAAIAVDWALAMLVSALFVGPDPLTAPGFNWWVLGVWFLLTAAPVAVFGASAGMTAVGIRVASIDSAPVVGVPRAVLRTAMTAVVVPPLLRDADGRGWHDRAARTIVVRTRD